MQKYFHIVFVSSMLILAGCASKEPTFGERMFAEGETRIEYAKLWEEGKNDVVKGDKLVNKGRELVEDGRDNLREGEQLVANGKMLAQSSRNAFHELSISVSDIDSPSNALKRANKLKDLAKKWEDGEDDVMDGKKLIKNGYEDISEGEAEIQKGQEFITRGREKMQQAQSTSL